MAADLPSLRRRFRSLHESGIFLMPNAWDAGSARILESIGFEAIATTSSGFAASLGRMDQNLSIEELAEHVRTITSVVGIPLSVDAESLYSDTSDGIARNVEILAGAGAAGISIEDFRPEKGLLHIGEASDMVTAAVGAARQHGVVVTARAENHLYGVDDLNDTITRLASYGAAGADVLYAPGLDDVTDIQRVVEETGKAVNALLLQGGPGFADLAGVGVRRVSVGGAFAFAAYGALAAAARRLISEGTLPGDTLTREDRVAAFGDE